MNNYNLFDEIKYEKISETADGAEKQKNWNIAFGLQSVDDLTPSDYMISLAKENIKGKKTYEQVNKEINSYYSCSQGTVNKDEQEADKVSLKIVKILNDNAFTFSYLTLKKYHKILFDGIDIGINPRYIGEFRDYNISKKEKILNGKSVIYADYRMIAETLKYDFEEEQAQKYTQMTLSEQIKRISQFTSRIWQVHPFGEGNTRTTAVFIQKYLNSKGFDINNELFKDNSLYFRNALVRANYSDIKNGIEESDSFLIKFFENLIGNGSNKFAEIDMQLPRKDNQ